MQGNDRPEKQCSYRGKETSLVKMEAEVQASIYQVVLPPESPKIIPQEKR
jgi:hypothetical protein